VAERRRERARKRREVDRFRLTASFYFDKYDAGPLLGRDAKHPVVARQAGCNGTCVIRHTFPMNMHLRGLMRFDSRLA